MGSSYSVDGSGRKVYDDLDGAMRDSSGGQSFWNSQSGAPRGGSVSHDSGGSDLMGSGFRSFMSSMGGSAAAPPSFASLGQIAIPEMSGVKTGGFATGPAITQSGFGSAGAGGPVATPSQLYMQQRDERQMALQAQYAERMAAMQAKLQAEANARVEAREAMKWKMEAAEAERNRQAQMVMQARGLGNDNYLAGFNTFKKWGI